MNDWYDFGPFFDGYVAATDKTRCGPRAMTEDSFDAGVDQATGALYRRPGSATVFDAGNAGLLESKWGARARQVIEMLSDSFSDGQPNVGVLYTDDADKEGTFYFRSSNGAGTNQQIGKSYSTTHRSAMAGTVWNFQMVPLWTQHATDIFTRCKSIAQRRVLMAGSRRVLRSGKNVIAPNRLGTPVVWNGRFNDATGSGSEKEFVRPLGPLGPVFPVRRTGVPAAVANSVWKGAEAAYYAVVYEFEDGSRSTPYIGAGTLGLVTVDAANPANRYPYVSLFIPPGPRDCVARIICRTNKWDTSAASYTVEDPTALFVCGVIRNNSQTAYNDYVGSDADLRERPDVIMLDKAMPPCARYCTTMDQRVLFADLAPNPCAIQLAPYIADGSQLDSYMYDDVAAYAAPFHFFHYDGTNLRLKYATPPGAGVTTVTIAIAGMTLQGLVDAINATTSAGGGAYEVAWRAQLAPGVDGNSLCTELQVTNAADYFDDDTACNDGTTGNCRVIAGHTLAGMLYFKASSAWMAKGVDRQGLHFTTGNPAATNTETEAPVAVHNWRGGYDCRRRVRSTLGRALGVGSLLDGALVVLSRGVGVLRNIRGGKTGADTDYRFEQWKASAGGIAWSGVAEGDGWVVYMSRKGLMVNDGKREVCISRRVWNYRANRGAGRGPWAYEIGQCVKHVAKDDDSCHFHVSVANGCIYVSYRSSSSVTYPDRQMVYDYSDSVNEIGVDQVLRADGTPYGWSAPYRLRVSCVGEVTRDDGVHVYGTVEDNGGGTGDGRLDEIELASTYTDNNVDITFQAYLQATDFGALREKKRVSMLDVEYYDDVGAAALSGSMTFARTDTATIKSPLAAVTDGTVSARGRFRIPTSLRKPCDVFEPKVVISSNATTRFELHRARARFKTLRTPR